MERIKDWGEPQRECYRGHIFSLSDDPDKVRLHMFAGDRGLECCAFVPFATLAAASNIGTGQ